MTSDTSDHALYGRMMFPCSGLDENLGRPRDTESLRTGLLVPDELRAWQRHLCKWLFEGRDRRGAQGLFRVRQGQTANDASASSSKSTNCVLHDLQLNRSPRGVLPPVPLVKFLASCIGRASRLVETVAVQPSDQL